LKPPSNCASLANLNCWRLPAAKAERPPLAQCAMDDDPPLGVGLVPTVRAIRIGPSLDHAFPCPEHVCDPAVLLTLSGLPKIDLFRSARNLQLDLRLRHVLDPTLCLAD
jgi:hypothetical protein